MALVSLSGRVPSFALLAAVFMGTVCGCVCAVLGHVRQILRATSPACILLVCFKRCYHQPCGPCTACIGRLASMECAFAVLRCPMYRIFRQMLHVFSHLRFRPCVSLCFAFLTWFQPWVIFCPCCVHSSLCLPLDLSIPGPHVFLARVVFAVSRKRIRCVQKSDVPKLETEHEKRYGTPEFRNGYNPNR